MNSQETRIATTQMVNLWGRSQGELPNEVKLVLIEDTSPQRAKLVFEHSVKTAGIPLYAEVRLYLYHHLRLVREEFGRLDEYLLVDGTTEETSEFSLAAFGERWKKASWVVKITTDDEEGRVWAWTKRKSVFRGKRVIEHEGEGILYLKQDDLDGIAWEIQFEDDCPTIVVNTETQLLTSELERKTISSALLIPEVFSNIIDEMLKLHLEGELLCADESTWPARWLNWIKKKYSSSIPNIDDEDPQTIIECIKWKEGLVKELKKTIEQTKIVNGALDRGEE